MKLILREHVEDLGDRGDIVNVATGYARNYLLPKNLAWEATAANIQQLEHQRRVWAARDAKEQSEAQQMADRLAELKLQVEHKAGESGTLYGSVTNSEVGALLAQRGFEVERRRILIAEPIKTVGDHEIQVRLHPKVVGKLTLTVVAEGQSE